jgi:peptide subunit release factor 1 (eRF1)
LLVWGSAFSLEPERPIRQTRYRCDKTFDLEEWDSLSTPPAAETWFGVALVHGRDTQLWKVSSLQAVLVQTLQCTTQKHQRKGGSSAARIQRLRENKLKHNVSFVGEALHAAFWDGDRNRPTVSALIVAGAAQMHDLVTDELNDGLRAVLVGPFPCDVHVSVRELFEQVQGDIARFQLARDRAALAPLHQILATAPELLEFGGFRAITELLSHFAQVFLCTRTHPDAVEELVRKFGKMPPNVVAIQVADDLDAYGGIVAIRHMPSEHNNDDDDEEQ